MGLTADRLAQLALPLDLARSQAYNALMMYIRAIIIRIIYPAL